jgi:hypothetical protein
MIRCTDHPDAFLLKKGIEVDTNNLGAGFAVPATITFNELFSFE